MQKAAWCESGSLFHPMKKLKNNQGFGLIETLISILLLSIIMIGGMSFYFNSSSAMTMAMHKKIAMEMANQALEKIKADGYAAIPPPGTSTVTFGDFSVQKQLSVTNIEGTLPNINKRVEIQMSWTESIRTTASTLTLATYMSP